MKKSSNTKKTFAASVISMLLCVVMLIGATFAWFTDSVVSGRNVIEAGNLDVELGYKRAGEDYQTVSEKTKLFAENVLWEPGHVEYVNLKVSNKGKLALKYQLSVKVDAETPGTNVNDETFKLSDYLQYAVVDGANTYTSDSAGRQKAIADATAAGTAKLSELSITKENELSSTGGADEVTLIVYMPESVGNEANYKTGTTAPSITLGVNLVATQTPSENDSFGNTYDENAVYPQLLNITDADSLKEALNNTSAPAEITVPNDIKGMDALTVSGDVTMNLGNSMIYNTISAAGSNVSVTEGGKLTLNAVANSGLNYTAGKLTADGEGSAITVNGGKYGYSGAKASEITAKNGGIVTVNDGNFSSSGAQGHAVTAETGSTVYINGGSYGSSGANSIIMYANGGTIIINKCDFGYANGSRYGVENGGKIMVAQSLGKPVANGYNVTEDGEYWVITAE